MDLATLDTLLTATRHFIAEWWLTILGHLSFAISFFSFAQRHIIRLRTVAAVAFTLSLVYNTVVQMRMPPDQNIYPVLIWVSILLAQNLKMLFVAVRDQMEVPLRPWQRELLVQAFPTMHSRDWAQMLAHGRVVDVPASTVQLRPGEATTALRIVIEGRWREIRPSGDSCVMEPGTMWGELTYALGADVFNASEVTIEAQSAGRFFEIDYGDLRALTHASERMTAAVNEGLVRAGMRKEFLRERFLLAPRAADAAVQPVDAAVREQTPTVLAAGG